MYVAKLQHCDIAVSDIAIIVTPRDNTVKSLEAKWYHDYTFDDFSWKGLIDRTGYGSTCKPEACFIDGTLYKDATLKISEQQINSDTVTSSVHLTVTRNIKGRDVIVYELYDRILKGGKYDED